MVRHFEKQKKVAERVYVYVLPLEIDTYKDNLKLIKRKTNLEVEIFAVDDKKKYDPQNKSSKAKPGKPGIYLE